MRGGGGSTTLQVSEATRELCSSPGASALPARAAQLSPMVWFWSVCSASPGGHRGARLTEPSSAGQLVATGCLCALGSLLRAGKPFYKETGALQSNSKRMADFFFFLAFLSFLFFFF